MDVVVEGKLVHYLEFNPRGTDVWVILHGWGHSSEVWRGLFRLCPSSWRLIVPDLPGFGKSQRLSGIVGIEEMANWVSGLVGKLGLEKIKLLGHSFGGQIAAYAVAVGKVEAEKLILVAPALERYEEKALPLSIKAWRSLTFLKPIIPRRLVNIISTSLDYAQADEEQRKILSRIIRQDVTPYLAKIDSPTLLVYGERDRELLGKPKLIAKRIHNSRMRVVYGVGHNIQLEEPAILVDYLKHFCHD